MHFFFIKYLSQKKLILNEEILSDTILQCTTVHFQK